MKHTNHLIGTRARRSKQLHELAAVLPVAGDVPHRPVRAQPRRPRQHPAEGGFDRLDGSETLPVWLQRAGYYTAEIGKYVNGYENSAVGCRRAGRSGTGPRSPTSTTARSCSKTGGSTPTARPNENPDHPAQPNTYSTDVFTDKAVNVINAQAPSPRPFFLYVAYLAPHGGGPDTDARRHPVPLRGHGQARHSRPQRVQQEAPAAAAELQRDADQRQASWNRQQPAPRPRPDQDRDPALSLQAGVAAGRRRGRRRIVEARSAAGESSTTRSSSSPRTTASSPASTASTTGKNRVYEEGIRVPLVMRGPGDPRGRHGRRPRDQRRPGADDPGRGRGDGRAGPRTAVADPAAEHPTAHGRRLLIEKGTAHDDAGRRWPAGRRLRRRAHSRYKYVQNGTGEVELYDLRSDPYELQNQTQTRRTTRSSRRSRLTRRPSRLRRPSCRRSPT